MRTQERILYIIKRLAKESCSVTQLSQEIYHDKENKHLRTIQKDISLLKKEYKEMLISPSRGIYKIITLPDVMNDLLNSQNNQEKTEMLNFMMIFDSQVLKLVEKDEPQIIKDLKQKIKSIYKIHQRPFENLCAPYVTEIELAVEHRRYVNVIYRGIERKEIQVYQIIYAQENWYIATYDKKEKNPTFALAFWRIGLIDKFELLSKTFQKDSEIVYFLDNFQTMFAHYAREPFEVKLHVNKRVKHYFQNKKYLPSQRVEESYDDGIIVRYQITDTMEIIPLIRKWLPAIKILEPDFLKKEVIKQVKIFLNKNI